MSQERKRALRANRDMLVLIDRRLEAARQTVPALAEETLDTTSFLSSFVSVLDKEDKRAGIRLFDNPSAGALVPVASPSGTVVIDSDAAFLLQRIQIVAEVLRTSADGGDAPPAFRGFVTPRDPLVKLRMVLNNNQVLTLSGGQDSGGGPVGVNYYSAARGFDSLDFNATLPVETALARNSVVQVEVEVGPGARSGDDMSDFNDYYSRLHVLFLGTKVFG